MWYIIYDKYVRTICYNHLFINGLLPDMTLGLLFYVESLALCFKYYEGG